MRLSAITLARVLGFVEIADLISGGKVSLPEMVRHLAEKYSFQKFPMTFEDLDISKGIEFLEGTSGEYPITKFVIWDTLMIVETRVNTDVSKAILEDMLLWASREVGINYKPGSIKRFGYISSVTFFSDAPLLDLHPAVEKLAASCTEEVSAIWQEPVKYESLSVRVGHDPTARKNGLAQFRIEHRAESRFSENKYFSESPLPTDSHLALLEQFERDITLSRQASSPGS